MPGSLARLPRPALLAMVHVGALPGTPGSCAGVAELARQAADEAKLLSDHGVDGIVLENMHDVPYLRGRVGPEVIAAMTAICLAARQATALPLGVQVLAGANRAALAVALAAGLQFIRAENFVFAHVADEGLMPVADAGRLMRYRRAIGAESIAVLADIKKKHAAHALTADVSLAETATAAEFFGAAGVVVTGSATGRPADPAEVRTVRETVRGFVAVGSGVTPDNLADFAPHADAMIVGSWFKRDGAWHQPPDAARLRRLVEAFGAVRGNIQR
ncbi:MAG: BtpA/SgcQ family protein [Phycisphaerae bacterium]